MTGDIGDMAEGLSDLATGGAVARAVEPGAGEGKGHGSQPGAGGHTHESVCLNCGTALAGPHCHGCGQRAHVHRTLSAFFHDLLHGVLHFEGKTWRTVPLLVWKPGKLTKEYIEGKRASYVSPIALFLFVVFLSYALFSALGGSEAFEPNIDGMDQVKAAYAANEKQLSELRKERKAEVGDAGEVARIDERIASLEGDQKGLSMVIGSPADEFQKGLKEGLDANPLPKGNSITEAWEKVRKNPQLAVYKVQTNAYKFSWMLIPLSVPFVWLLFPFNRRFRGYDHTVFTTYSITFMIALVAVSSLLFYFGLGAIGGLILFYAPYHMYRQLRGAYGASRVGAFLRMLALSVFAWIAIGLFVSIVTAMAAGH